MMKFEELRKELFADEAKQKKEVFFFIENGFFASWAAEHRTDADRGLKKYLTPRKWEAYTAGTLDKAKATESAMKRAAREIEKRTQAKLARLEAVEAAEAPEFIYINVEFIRSRSWGYNPHAEVTASGERTHGSASGCGYDKESAAVADALNQNNGILKILYTLKENALREGKTDESKTAVTGHDNRNIIGYGAGYSVLPYFEAGVGVECFRSILQKAGYKWEASYGKKENFYTVRK